MLSTQLCLITPQRLESRRRRFKTVQFRNGTKLKVNTYFEPVSRLLR